jgi:hypothetical protein
MDKDMFDKMMEEHFKKFFEDATKGWCEIMRSVNKRLKEKLDER